MKFLTSLTLSILLVFTQTLAFGLGTEPGSNVLVTQTAMQGMAEKAIEDARGKIPVVADIEDQIKQKEAVLEAYKKDPTPIVLKCEVMGYDWGDPNFIPALLRIDNSEGKPYAELWIGAHPKGPSRADIADFEFTLIELIEGAADEILGPEIAAEYGVWPNLFKVLTASTALSIQAHPDKKHAKKGWKKQGNKKGPLYTDNNHKPELVYAVTYFWAMVGFRPLEDIIKDFKGIELPGLRADIEAFESSVKASEKDQEKRKAAIKNFYSAIMMRVDTLKKAETAKEYDAAKAAQIEGITPIVTRFVRETEKKIIQKLEFNPDKTFDGYISSTDIDAIMAKANYEGGKDNKANFELIKDQLGGIFLEYIKEAEKQGKVEELRRELWSLRLYSLYPNDMGVLSPYLLNLEKLSPGEAMFLPAGELHAYIGKLNPNATDEGFGMEIMASSDNTLRGGLTPKLVDVPELLKILTFESGDPKILTAKPKSPVESVIKTPASEFQLSILSLDDTKTYSSDKVHSADTLIVKEGVVKIIYTCRDTREKQILIEQGQTIMIPAALGMYRVEAVNGPAKLFKASVPLDKSSPPGNPEEAEKKQQERSQKRAAVDVKENTKVYTVADGLEKNQMAIFIPQAAKMTNDMEKARTAMKKRGISLEIVRYRKDKLLELMENHPDAKKLVILDKEMAEWFASKIEQDNDLLEKFKDVRILSMDIPDATPEDGLRTVYQSKMIMIALLARMAEGNERTPEIKELLLEMLDNSFAGSARIDTQVFYNTLTEDEDADTPVSVVKERIKYFISEKTTISLVKQLDIQLRIMRKFWTYA